MLRKDQKITSNLAKRLLMKDAVSNALPQIVVGRRAVELRNLYRGMTEKEQPTVKH